MRQNDPLCHFLDGPRWGQFIRVQKGEGSYPHTHPAGLTCLPLVLLNIWRTARLPTATAAAFRPLCRRAGGAVVIAFWRHCEERKMESSIRSLWPLPGPASNSCPLRGTPTQQGAWVPQRSESRHPFPLHYLLPSGCSMLPNTEEEPVRAIL